MFATRYQSRLNVLSVIDPLLADAARIRLGQDLAKETEPTLREFAAATWADGPVAPAGIIYKVRTGTPHDVILATATSDAAELIVMGTQGLGGFHKWLLGSTTERVLRRTPVPVLAVPPAGTTLEVVRILAATDFSEASVAALRWAAELEREFSATLTLMHVVEPLTVPPQWRSLVEESDETRVARARATLDGLAERLCGPHGCEAIVSVGRPADVIRSVAGDRRADLIVMGLMGEQGFLGPRPGSIAYRVLTSATAPVFAVPPSANGSDYP